ncbi:MAG: acetoacetate--CoA ligase [Zetaproteobacteria bacterium]|nr:acetoacetate--CoA ligase [Pseudobdellovibrionaceae bacterium]
MAEIFLSPRQHRMDSCFMEQFREYASKQSGLSLSDYWDLYNWSIESFEDFWGIAASFLNIKFHQEPQKVYAKGRLLRSGEWFPGATLNFAENLMPAFSEKVFLTAYQEGMPVRYLSGQDIWKQVAGCAASLKKKGVKKGDRIAGVLKNGPEAVIAMLAATSLGAIWSSCSPDFGVNGIVDRLGQIKPKVLFFSTSYVYSGKQFNCIPVLEEVISQISGIDTIVGVKGTEQKVDPSYWKDWETFLDPSASPDDLKFETVSFSDPLYIMFSSGTTGVPKCIVHGVGGTLLQHKKELILHTGLSEGKKLFYFTTCGWMMWNWMVSALGTGAGIVTFDGAVNQPDLGALWRLIAKEKVSVFGTSPKFLSACMNGQISPSDEGVDQKLETILSTGSPLLPEHFAWVKSHLGDELQLSSICGGTDIISCFMLGNPTLPIHQGQIQGPGLGMAIEAWQEDGTPVVGKKAELVCTKPFVSMPIGFWNDPNDAKYHSAYFDAWPGRDVWHHGDFIEITDKRGVIVYGRSDATLNPGGVRIGTAEIYRQVENLVEIDDSIASGHPIEGDTDILLFVKMAEGHTLDDLLIKNIKNIIKRELTPRHVPAKIYSVIDIPYTRSGKKVEMAVTKAIHGEEVMNKSALANPESLDYFLNFSDIKD